MVQSTHVGPLIPELESCLFRQFKMLQGNQWLKSEVGDGFSFHPPYSIVFLSLLSSLSLSSIIVDRQIVFTKLIWNVCYPIY